MADRRREGSYDVEVAASSDEELAGHVAKQLALKGYCVLAPGALGSVPGQRARAEAEALEFYPVHEVVADGLLGPEGSPQVADLEALPPDEEAAASPESLHGIDAAFSRLWHALAQYSEWIDAEMTHRSDAVVHRSGEAADDSPGLLNEKEVTKWQSQFLRHRLMAATFLGPKTGDLELEAFDQEDAEPIQVRAAPGCTVVLRADLLTRRLTGAADIFAVSCFFLAGVDRRGVPAGRITLTPAARKLEEWMVNRLQELKAKEEQDHAWDAEIPRCWQVAMNHSYHRGQLTGIGGDAVHFPGTYDADTWFRGSTGGPDYATEVPLTRWNHTDFYDPEEEGYLRLKTFCNHGCFMEGTELFDNKFFSLSPHESKGLDPHARILLEVGYCALARMGYQKKQLMNSAGGVYVGATSHEWMFAGGMAPVGGCSGVLCMFSGRISFCLGMKGPSISLSTEGASGLTAALLAAESVQQKGTAVGNDFAIAIGVHILLSPVNWPNECMQGWMSQRGRCMTFDSGADGYIRSDGCASIAVKNTTKLVDGEIVKNETDRFLGTVAGGIMMNSGQSASMSAPNAAAEQQVVAEAIRNACLSPLDIDGVEAFGVGSVLSDAVEVSALWRGHRSEMEKERLGVTAVKSSIGNQVECSGITGLLKVLHAAMWGYMTPHLHIRQANPHVDMMQEGVDILTEDISFPFRSTFNGVKARGLGGSNVYVIIWGSVADEPEPAGDDQMELQRRALPGYWPEDWGEEWEGGEEAQPAEG